MERGNFMMSWKLGNYGFLNTDSIAEQSLCINDLGLESRTNENYSYDNLNRDYYGYLFQYTLDGSGIYESSGVEYKLTKGKAFFITFPEDSRYYFKSDTGENSNNQWTFFYLHINGPAVEPFFRRIRELTGPVLELEKNSSSITHFFELYESLCHHKQLERYQYSEWLYRFLISLLRNVEFLSNRTISNHVAAAIDWIRENYRNQINLEEMSKDIGVTYSHLTRQFCKEQGMSPVEYLTHIRLEHGMQLLLNTNLPIIKIAEECGFSCANYFTKVYKKALNMTPGDYRKQHKLW